jgi:glycopeptide antibiotics resistance protein
MWDDGWAGWRRTVPALLFVGYAVGVIAVTIFPITPPSPEPMAIHYVPFVVDAPSFVLNVVLFVPFGVLVPLLRPAADAYRQLACRALATSAGIELTQLVLGVVLGSRRTVDVNDLIANTAGAVAGLLVLRLAVPVAAHRASVSRAAAGNGSPR